ncbi:MAG: DNA mismatch repair endonuclease MutL [Bacteriovoracaceae bacterium]|nr:DNA mismatch repair endonuclease MutL [Bacteriovoracaceae bacterium]
MTTPGKPGKIRLLPEHLIDQIKAGEVIERPANVVKELLENALDSGASVIDLEIRENGLNLIRVIDNGSGIYKDDIPIAFGRHATSKINSFEDLYRLSTFGFRGEALPSIASVSKLECVSWTSEEKQGGSLRFEGGLQGELISVSKSGKNNGTIMSVQDLFFNTPARLKFLQSATSEKNWIKKFFYAFVIANPKISFSLLWDDSERLIYPATETTEERIKQLFSRKAAERLVIHSACREWNHLKCRVYATETFGSKSDGPIEHVNINGRPVLDKAYHRVIQQVLESQMTFTPPIVSVSIEVPGDQVDVNVHPNKTHLKFHQMGEILSLLSSTLREAIPKTSQPVSQTTLDTKIPLSSLGRSDIESHRGESYAGHIERSVTDSNAEMNESQVLFHQSGPYFIWKSSLQATPFYVNGPELLASWVDLQSVNQSTSFPLLVSHPLREIKISNEIVQSLNNLGYEIDELEPGFYVVREIPIWGKGIPLHLLLQISINQKTKAQSLPSIHFYEISTHKWEEILNAFTADELKKNKLIIDLTPDLFSRN